MCFPGPTDLTTKSQHRKAVRLERIISKWRGGFLETQSERKGEIVMTKNIKWETEIDAALALARVEKKPVLLDFFNPG